MSAPIVLLGIDPGTRVMGAGWLICDRERPEQILGLGWTTLEPKRRAELPQRLSFLQSELRLLIEELRPSQVIVERVFLGKNVESAFTLGLSRGVVLAALGEHGAEFREEATRTVKKSVTGDGGAEKEDVRARLVQLLGLHEQARELPLDASDALALAYHAWRLVCIEARLRGSAGRAPRSRKDNWGEVT
ncbi:MAG TPA: crossover junction endodeoxyribonuclease RuvC [Pseudobdellovibrionaceae bacterium]|nr:crossover junction endodeoxyribonuclease RuvC [Pseudobdellovibrionaceae bacterium]